MFSFTCQFFCDVCNTYERESFSGERYRALCCDTRRWLMADKHKTLFIDGFPIAAAFLAAVFAWVIMTAEGRRTECLRCALSASTTALSYPAKERAVRPPAPTPKPRQTPSSSPAREFSICSRRDQRATCSRTRDRCTSAAVPRSGSA